MRTFLLIPVIVAALCLTAAGDVLLNEMEFNPLENDTQWIELYNSGEEDVNISGWTAVISEGSWKGKMVLPEGTVIAPGGFYVTEGDPRWQHQDSCKSILYDASGVKVDESPTRIDLLGNYLTWGRYPDGTEGNGWKDWGYMMATKEMPNQL